MWMGPGLWWLGGPGAGVVPDPSSNAGTEGTENGRYYAMDV